MPNLDVKNTREAPGGSTWSTVDQWYQTYWSGLDARFYVGNILVDEIISLQWELVEAVMPLFGYADYTMRKGVHGARRVQGAFQINFKRDSYIYEILRTLNNPQITGATGTKGANGQSLAAWRTARTGSATVEDFTALSAGGQPNPGSSGSGQGASLSAVNLQALSNVSSAFEQAIWGSPSANPPAAAVGAVKFAQLHSPRFQLNSAFDLGIQFGSVSPQQLATRQASVNSGQAPAAQQAIPVQTSSKIVGVELSGRQTVVDDSGRPVIETYTFVARDVL